MLGNMQEEERTIVGYSRFRLRDGEDLRNWTNQRIRGSGCPAKERGLWVDVSTPRLAENDWPHVRRLGQCYPILEMQSLRSSARKVQPVLRGAVLSPIAPAIRNRDVVIQPQCRERKDGFADPGMPGTTSSAVTSSAC